MTSRIMSYIFLRRNVLEWKQDGLHENGVGLERGKRCSIVLIYLHIKFSCLGVSSTFATTLRRVQLHLFKYTFIYILLQGGGRRF